jgi:hypothetical protein
MGAYLTSKELPARLWKFGSSKKKRVKIEFCEELTVEWLKGTSTMIDRERQKVVDCFHARGEVSRSGRDTPLHCDTRRHNLCSRMRAIGR